MPIHISENLSLLASPVSLRQKPGSTTIQQERGFGDRLERALSGDSPMASSSENARVLAESLSLQMLQRSLSLAGDSPAETAAVRPSSSVNSLLRAYSANLAETGSSPAASSTSAPAPSQLHELSGTQEETPPQAEIQSKHSDSSWLDPIISRASRRYGVDAGLIKAVIKAESNFNPSAVSHAGARGLMQLMPGTARSLGVNDSFDPEQNVMGGTRFLRDLLDRYNGDVDSALAAYNWGPGNVDRRPDRMPAETRNYLARVKQLHTSYTG